MSQETKSFNSICPSEFHKVNYNYWSTPSAKENLICVHGVTRNSKDFFFLAQQLKDNFNIACPDIAGRGDSDYLSNVADYNFDNYATDISIMAAHLDFNHFNYLGTSMGGIVGIKMAAKRNSPIKKLVLNDIGPFVPKTLFIAVKSMVATAPKYFNSFEETLKFFAKNSLGFGPMTGDQLSEFTDAAVAETGDGKQFYNYDPHIVDRWTEDTTHDLNMWSDWDKIQCPVLILRGKNSPALSKETAEEMLTRGPNTTMVEFENTGHAPHLLCEKQAAIIKKWLLK